MELLTTVPNLPSAPHETQRFAALRDYPVHDTLPEEAYDDITRLAAQLCGARTSLLILISCDRHWFKSRLGIGDAEALRYLAFFSQARGAADEALFVEDATADERFATDDLVTRSPFLRFFVGAPLMALGGDEIGTLCVMDPSALQLTEAQRTAFRALTRQVVTHLELRRRVAALERKDDLMVQFQDELKQYQTKLKETTTQLHQQSVTDALTGVFNRRALMAHLDRAVRSAKEHQEPLALVMLDVDNFKRFNDNFGHLAGDDVLRRVAQRVQGVIGKHDVVARYGGEEFAVIMPGTEGPAALVMASQLCEAIRDMPWNDRPVTISAGVASIPGHAAIPEEWITAADRAMYAAKQAGRDRAILLDR